MEKNCLENKFHFMEDRLATFVDWPFKQHCACAPEKLAEAGFIYCGSSKEPDLVRCYVCFKELDNWVPDDDPWQEHMSHSSNCPFIKVNNHEQITLREFLQMDKTRGYNIVDSHIQNSNAEWNKVKLVLDGLTGSGKKLKKEIH